MPRLTREQWKSRDWNAPTKASRAATRRLHLVCGRKTPAGRTCRQLPGNRTDHRGYGPCRAHGTRDEHEGWVIAVEIAKELNITPWEALLKGVRLAAGRVAWVDQTLEQTTRACDGNMEDPRVVKWLKESRLERTLMAKMAKAAIDAGVAERLVRQTEMEGQLVAAAVVKALDSLDFLTLEQRSAALNAAHTALLAAGGDQTVTIQGTTLHDDRKTSRDTTVTHEDDSSTGDAGDEPGYDAGDEPDDPAGE